MIIRLLILVLAWVLLVESQASARPLSEDVCRKKKHKEVNVRDTIKQSNVVFMPDSLIQDTLKYEFSKIKKVADRRKWTKELYKMIFVNPRKYNIDIVETENSEDRYQPYRGKIIRDIHVKVLPSGLVSMIRFLFSRIACNGCWLWQIPCIKSLPNELLKSK